jgi:hypothetical protein
LPVRQDGDVETVGRDVVVDTAADMIGEQDFLAFEALDAGRIQVVGMAVREPDVVAGGDVVLEVLRNAVGEHPAAEIGRLLVADPRVGGEQRLAVVDDDRRVTGRGDFLHSATSGT